jgi:hypothetical protein
MAAKFRTRTLPTLAGLALLGTAFGVHLGQGAVSEIDPFWFTKPDSGTFYADMTPNRPDWSAPQPLRASQDVPIVECVGCLTKRDDATLWAGAYPGEETVSAGEEVYRPAAAPRAGASDAAYVVQAAAPDPERERVVRYTRYAVTEAEAAAEAQAEDYADAPGPVYTSYDEPAA